jgi:hypothetical protein
VRLRALMARQAVQLITNPPIEESAVIYLLPGYDDCRGFVCVIRIGRVANYFYIHGKKMLFACICTLKARIYSLTKVYTHCFFVRRVCISGFWGSRKSVA